MTPIDWPAINFNLSYPSALNDNKNLVTSVGYGRKVVESFKNMKARIGMNKLQRMYLQCEDLHCKENLKLHRRKKEGQQLASAEQGDAKTEERTEQQKEDSGERKSSMLHILPFYLPVQCLGRQL